MVVQEDIPMMELFRKSVNASREALAKVEVREELTYHYAIVRVYSKMLVTSCAIYTLLINGYPDDAMALCRQLYESLVIIDTLLKGKQKNDTELLERFMDAPAIMELKNDYEMVLYALKHDPNNQHAKSQLDMINNGSQKYLQKYRKDEIKDFKDYWWSGYDNLTKISETNVSRRLFSLAFFPITCQGQAAASGGGCVGAEQYGSGGNGLRLRNLEISDFVTEVAFTEFFEQSHFYH